MIECNSFKDKYMYYKLKYFLLYFFTAVILGGTSITSVASPAVPSEVEALMPVGTNLIDYQVADLNADGSEDALIVVEKRIQPDVFAEVPRITMILLRNKNGQLELAEKNDQAYLCKRCLGSRDDIEQYLTVGKGTFEVSNHGGSPGYRRYKKFKFQYNTKNKTWILSKVETSISDENADGHDKFQTKMFIYPKSLKKITFSQFKINNNWIAEF
jgi:hypothetical protein